jgi:hypothetical protein
MPDLNLSLLLDLVALTVLVFPFSMLFAIIGFYIAKSRINMKKNDKE